MPNATIKLAIILVTSMALFCSTSAAFAYYDSPMDRHQRDKLNFKHLQENRQLEEKHQHAINRKQIQYEMKRQAQLCQRKAIMNRIYCERAAYWADPETQAGNPKMP